MIYQFRFAYTFKFQSIRRSVFQNDTVVVLFADVLDRLFQKIFNEIVVIFFSMPIEVKLSLDFCPKTIDIYVIKVVITRRLYQTIFCLGMTDTIYSDVMDLMYFIIFQIEINQVFYSSTKNCRNRQYTRC